MFHQIDQLICCCFSDCFRILAKRCKLRLQDPGNHDPIVTSDGNICRYPHQHRENISQKKQELQKAQEARQTVHANGSATAGATRSHERPVATPVPKPAQTDTVTKPDMKRPATSPVIKNAEVKTGKETVRTNIRQEQQVKSVARTNQQNVAESISNRKKTTVQKQVNQKQNRKTVTKHSEKGRKK